MSRRRAVARRPSPPCTASRRLARDLHRPLRPTPRSRRRDAVHGGDGRRATARRRDMDGPGPRGHPAGRLERRPVLRVERRDRRLRLRAAPRRAGGHGAHARRLRRLWQQRPVVRRDDRQRHRPGRAVRPARIPHRPAVYGVVARRPSPRPRLPDTTANRPPPSMVDPGGLRRGSRRLRGSDGCRRGRDDHQPRMGGHLAGRSGRGGGPAALAVPGGVRAQLSPAG